LDPTERADDTELIRRAQRGEESAFRGLVERWYARIYRWAIGATGDADDADDVTQQVLVRLHLGLSRDRGDARFSTWLFQVTRNAARDLSRRRRRREHVLARLSAETPPAELGQDPVEELEIQEAVAVARTALASLPGRQREVFDLVELQGYGAAEAAHLLGLSAGTVRAHLFRARRAVRTAVIATHPAFQEDRS
jgi:RNA polymerase sigma-70 factor (ECF subfamily)